MMKKRHNNAVTVLKTLNKAGFEGYLVGGCVRDNFLGLDASDIDIATNAIPEQVVALFQHFGRRVIPTGMNHGTVTVVVNEIHYEVTTYRKDVETDGRNATIEFAKTIQEDLARRDFTINAMAYNPLTEELIDPHNGMVDIVGKTIRAVGDPMVRLKEDYLRMLRALRFSAQLGFTIDMELYAAIHEVGHFTEWDKTLSVERIREEIMKTLSKADSVNGYLRNMSSSAILGVVIPEVDAMFGVEQNKWHEFDLFTHTLKVVDGISKEHPLIRFAALLHDTGKVDTREGTCSEDFTFHGHEEVSVEHTANIMKRLKFSMDEREFVGNLVGHHMRGLLHDASSRTARRFINSIGVSNIESHIILCTADSKAKNSEVLNQINVDTRAKRFRETILKTLETHDVFDVTKLAINGHDVMERGIKAGPMVGQILRSLFDHVVDGVIVNEREVLLSELNERVENV